MASAIKLKNQVTKLEAAKKAATKGKNTKLAAKFQSQIEVLKGQIKALNKPTGSPAVQAAKQLAREYKAKYGVSFNGVDIEKDALVPAFKTGRRVSQGIKGNQFASKKESKGHVYYEYRENRIDRNAKRYPKLEDGGVMAKGGVVKVGDILTASTGVKVRVVEYDPKFGGRIRAERLDEYATGKPSQFMPLSKFKYADGGSLDSILLDTGGASSSDVGGTLFSNADLTPQMDITNPMFKKGGKLNNYKYVPNRMIQAVEVERNGRETEIDGANVIDGLYVKKGVKFEHGGETHRGEGGSMYALGGQLEGGFTISKMNEILKKEFEYTFGVRVFPLKRGTHSEPNYDWGGSSLYGINDSELKQKLHFPQYKRDHMINFSISQGDENTYFDFLLEGENGDGYVGTFGFKDRGDVPSDYVTKFLAFLMEAYGLPFKVSHDVI